MTSSDSAASPVRIKTFGMAGPPVAEVMRRLLVQLYLRPPVNTIPRTNLATVFLPPTFVTGFFGQNFGWLVRHQDSFAAFAIYGIGGLVVPLAPLAVAASPADACGGHATSGSCRPHPARPRPGPQPPLARSASQGCWPRQASACRGPPPTRFPGDQTECPTAGTWPGACACRQPHGRCRLAWHPPKLAESQPVYAAEGRGAQTAARIARAPLEASAPMVLGMDIDTAPNGGG